MGKKTIRFNRRARPECGVGAKSIDDVKNHNQAQPTEIVANHHRYGKRRKADIQQQQQAGHH